MDYRKKRPCKGWSGIHLIHNFLSHMCEASQAFLRLKTFMLLTIDLNHQTCVHEAASYSRIFKMTILSGKTYNSRSTLGSPISQCLQQMQIYRIFRVIWWDMVRSSIPLILLTSVSGWNYCVVYLQRDIFLIHLTRISLSTGVSLNQPIIA